MRIFIGWDAREAVAADVLAYSLRKHATVPLDIRYLKLEDSGMVWYVVTDGTRSLPFSRPRDPLQSTDFTYTRFMVPALCRYSGLALFMDCDMLCLGDIREITEAHMDELSLRVVKHPPYVPPSVRKMDGCVQSSYPRKNWSSLMLMNCARLGCWTQGAVERQTGAFLHRFEGIPDNGIGSLSPAWNSLDACCLDAYSPWLTKMIHFTSGGPWFKGYENCAGADLWRQYKEEMDFYGQIPDRDSRTLGLQAPDGEDAAGCARQAAACAHHRECEEGVA